MNLPELRQLFPRRKRQPCFVHPLVVPGIAWTLEVLSVSAFRGSRYRFATARPQFYRRRSSPAGALGHAPRRQLRYAANISNSEVGFCVWYGYQDIRSQHTPKQPESVPVLLEAQLVEEPGVYGHLFAGL